MKNLIVLFALVFSACLSHDYPPINIQVQDTFSEEDLDGVYFAVQAWNRVVGRIFVDNNIIFVLTGKTDSSVNDSGTNQTLDDGQHVIYDIKDTPTELEQNPFVPDNAWGLYGYNHFAEPCGEDVYVFTGVIDDFFATWEGQKEWFAPDLRKKIVAYVVLHELCQFAREVGNNERGHSTQPL